MLIAGGNDNIVEQNYIFDNWRRGTMLHWVPAGIRGDQDPAKSNDTSTNNRYADNCMGVRPADLGNVDFGTCAGTQDLNGVDFWWDEQEGQDCIEEQAGCVEDDSVKGNCWSGNTGLTGPATSDPVALLLPACPGLDTPRPSNTNKLLELIPCASWDPETNPDPPGCNWFTRPPEP
jgi:hypothetical protein